VRKGFEYVDYAVVALAVLLVLYAVIRGRRRRGEGSEPAADAPS
jgi:hypothetical protein